MLLAWEYLIDLGYIEKITPDGQSIPVGQTSLTYYPKNANAYDTVARDIEIGANGQPIAYDYKRTRDQKGNAYFLADNALVLPIGPTGTLVGLQLRDADRTTDGTGGAARFQRPVGMAVDASGNVYVADAASNTIRKTTPDGVVSTFAGSPGVAGSKDGTGSNALFSRPTGLAVDGSGTLYVADTNNHTIRKISPAGETTTLAGDAGNPGSNDGQGAAARFNFPNGIAVDATGNVYVTDPVNARIRKITASGDVTTLSPVIYNPAAIALDPSGNIFVTASNDNVSARTSYVCKITPDEKMTFLAGSSHGSADGSGTAARFHFPTGLVADASGNLFVADSFNQTVRKISPQGAVTTIAGLADAPGSTDATGRDARFYYPQGMAIQRQTGTLYVSSGTTIRKGQLATLSAITGHPQSVSIASGNDATFSVTASGTPTPTFQWQRNGNAIPGATSNILKVPGASTSDAGDYTVVVTNALGSVTSNKATLTVSSTSTPTPSPTGGSSGGGSIEAWFAAVLASVTALRLLRCRR